MCRELFPDGTHIPKQRFSMYQLAKICKLSLYICYWCTRFESNHAPAKEFSKTIHNVRIISKNVAWQLQIRLCIFWVLEGHLAVMPPEVDPVSELLTCTLAVLDLVFTDAGVDLFEETFLSNHIESNSFEVCDR
jgi:hypothetical protein